MALVVSLSSTNQPTKKHTNKRTTTPKPNNKRQPPETKPCLFLIMKAEQALVGNKENIFKTLKQVVKVGCKFWGMFLSSLRV